jgi:hypothetical protein
MINKKFIVTIRFIKIEELDEVFLGDSLCVSLAYHVRARDILTPYIPFQFFFNFFSIF